MSKAKVCRNSFFFVVFRKYCTVEELLDEMSGEWVFIVNQNLELALLSLAKSYLKLSGM